MNDKTIFLYTGFLLFVVLLGIIGPRITPYGYDEYLYTSSGELMRVAPPTWNHPLGTTHSGRDVLSRLIYGARPTAITGAVGGLIIITIGTTVGVTAGYIGGLVDEVLMRITDFVFGVPLIPFAMVLIAMMEIGFVTSLIVIGIILWRSSARALRSQVLQIKEREYIMAIESMGGSNLRIIFKHILPNIAPMIMLLFSLAIGYAILVQASLAFIGVVNPFTPSWGVMLRNAFDSGFLGLALWWSIPPGIMISLTVLSAFMLGRKLVGEGTEDIMGRAG